MTASTSRIGRLAAGAAVLLAAAVGAGAFALPAAAQDDGVAHPYLHSDLSFAEVEPGESISVTPTLFQEDPLPEDTAAVIVNFAGSAGSGFFRSDVRIEAPYDNCQWGLHYPQSMFCIVTEFEDLAGSPVAPTVPVAYAVGETTPGPVDICKCSYRVFTVNAEVLDRDFGSPTWDPDSDNLLGLAAADSWDGPSTGDDPSESGAIVVETTEHPYDLAVEDVAVGGEEGEEVTATVSLANLGPANTLTTSEVPGSTTVRGELPAGLDFVGIEFDEDPFPEWTCLESEEELAQEYARVGDATELQRFDFACFTGSYAPDSAREFELTMEIADAEAVAGGRIETDVVPDGHGWPPDLESDRDNNHARIVVDVEAGPSGKLPATGTSLTMVIGIAALVLVAGVVLMVLTARRRRATAAE